MTRPYKTLSVLGILAVALMWATPASAQCAFSQSFGNALGTWFDCDDSGTVQGVAQAVNAGGTLVSSVPTAEFPTIICRSTADDNVQGGFCPAEAGTIGDGQLTIRGNWGSPGVTGCPNDLAEPGVGRNIFSIRDSSGRELVISVGYDGGLGGYAADFAIPATGQSFACGSESTHITVNNSSDTGTELTLDLTVTGTAPMITDCDPGSIGQVDFTGRTCTPADVDFLASLVPTNIYSNEMPCNDSNLRLNDDTGTLRWANHGPVPAGGNASITVPSPADGNCAFVGTGLGAPASEGVCFVVPLACTSDADCDAFGVGPCILGSSEFGVVSGAVRVSGGLAAPPRVVKLVASVSKAHVAVNFRTTTELGLDGIRLITPSGREIANIEPRGQGGGHQYTESVHRKMFRGEKAVSVQLMLSSGDVITSDPASF